ncbi:MAG TPA: trypsin-like serine protease [Gaiellaceae bacterium]|nr:trypsin-like serine protease [Gaiellaceae bacterium]
MRRFVRLAPLAVAFVVLGLAVGLPQAGAIINGTPDDGTVDGIIHPNVGIVYNDTVPWNSGFCSGTLISPTVFLTAGHCTATFIPANIAHIHVSFDAHLSVSPENTIIAANRIDVTGWETDPDFGYVRVLNDVGVFYLKDPVYGVTPAELPDVGFLDEQAAKNGLAGHEFDIVGYGLNSLDHPIASPQANFTWNQEREYSTQRFRALTPNDLAQFGPGTCYADSGGPHFYGGDQPNLEVALTSSGNPICTTGAWDNSQRLDTPAVHDWLQGILADH